MTKVIYVCIGRLTDKMARDWYIDYLIARGVCVEYWDIVSLVREEHTEQGALNPDYLRICRSFDELERLIEQPENWGALYILLLTYAGKLTRVFRIFSRHRCRMATFHWGSLPQDHSYSWRKVAAWLARPGKLLRELASRSHANALRRLDLVRPFELVFAAGAVAIAGARHAARVVPVNYFDYDHYVQVRAGVRLIAQRYAVFLDIYLPHHSDLEFVGYPRIEAEPYFRSLNRFFAEIERQFDLIVVIAAHPRAAYDDSVFEGRPIVRMATAELVRDAEFVLTHTSTSMSYAVLNAKPLILIYTAEMAVAYERLYIREMRCFADYLDVPLYNIDAGDPLRVRPVNMQRYERYKYDFLTSPESEKSSTPEILWAALAGS